MYSNNLLSCQCDPILLKTTTNKRVGIYFASLSKRKRFHDHGSKKQ